MWKYKCTKYFVRKLNWMCSLSTIFSDAAFWSKNSKTICLRRTKWAVWIAVLLLCGRNILPYFYSEGLYYKYREWHAWTNVCQKSKSKMRKAKAAEKRGVTSFLWRCDIWWSLLAQLREWWMYDRYECCTLLSNENNGKCSVMSVMVPCVFSTSDSGFPLYLLFLVFTECNIVNSIHNLQWMKLLCVLYGCFSFGFGLLFSVVINFKAANFGKIQSVYRNDGDYLKIMAMKSAFCPPHLLQTRKVWKQMENGRCVVRNEMEKKTEINMTA